MVTVLVELTPLVDGDVPARLIDMRPGRSADVLKTWLDERDPPFRDTVEVVAMDGFTGYATAVDHALPAARKVMDTFHVVHLAADRLTGTVNACSAKQPGGTGRKVTRCTSPAGAC